MPVHDEQDLIEAMQDALQAAVWPGTATKIFGATGTNVVVSKAPPFNVIQTLGTPAAFISPMSGMADQDEPFLHTLQVAVTVVVMAAGDTTGQHAMLGAGQTTNKGLLAVCKEVIRTVGKMNKDDGVPIVCRARSNPAPVIDDGHVYMLARDLIFDAVVSMEYET